MRKPDPSGGASALPLPDAVRWFEGMRLAPQHFQQLSARHEMLAPLLLRSVLPLHWGLLHLAMRQDGSVVTVTGVEAIMPDGLPVSSRPADTLSIDLARSAPDDDGLWRLALAVPARGSGERAGPQRYLDVGSAQVADQNPGGVPATVSLLRPNLQLVCGAGHAYASEELLPLMQFRDNGGVPLQTGYMAPWLHVSRTLPLYGSIDSLCRKLRANYHTLANEQANGAALARRQAILPQLGARLLELECVLQDGNAHPHTLYLLLAGLLGALTAGLPGLGVPRLARFDYRDLAPAMEALLNQIEQVRTRLAPDYDWAPFSARAAHNFEIDLSRVAAAQPFVIALHKPARANDADMARWLREALVCSAGREEDLQRRRSRGINKAALASEPTLRYGGDSTRTLFQLDMSGEAADSFDPHLALRILGPGGSADNYIEPMAIELLLRREPQAGEPN